MERLGSLFLKLPEHAYGRSSKLDDDLAASLQAMLVRLKTGRPHSVSSVPMRCWHVFTDAAYEQDSQCGGLWGVLWDCSANVCSWFGVEVSASSANILAEKSKLSLIYKLVLAAAIVAIRPWGKRSNGRFARALWWQ